MANMAMGGQSGLSSSFSMMEDGDDYMDYMGGGSPLGLSSESSNQDRSCSSTPVGNESSPAGRSPHTEPTWPPVGSQTDAVTQALCFETSPKRETSSMKQTPKY